MGQALGPKWLGMAFLGLMITACGASPDVAVARAATEHAYENFQDGRVGALYEGGTSGLKAEYSRSDFARLPGLISENLGSRIETRETGWSMLKHPTGLFVELIHESRYERGSSREVFRWKVVGDRAQLDNFVIESEDLLLR